MGPGPAGDPLPDSQPLASLLGARVGPGLGQQLAVSAAARGASVVLGARTQESEGANWFVGGDLYTAYTFVAVPAAMYATGSVTGFFAVPYTIVLYPIIFVFMARLWSVSHRHGYVTSADFVKGRYGSRELSLAIAVWGWSRRQVR